MSILSLFDGMSCAQIALKNLGIVTEKYYASEIDKYAIAQTQLNFPNTIQLGSVVDIDVNKLEPIQLIIGGSPCQSFSFSGKRKGMSTKCNEEIYTLERYLELKENGFEFEGYSYLFWEYMRILTDVRKYNPDVKFLLENVEMGYKWERVLSEAIGIYGVHINSSLVSAQSRKRIYWTNIKTRKDGLFSDLYSDIPQPKDRGIIINDILESEVSDKYLVGENMLKKAKIWSEKKEGVVGHSGSGGQHGDIYATGSKMGALCASDYKQPKQIIVHNMMGRKGDAKKGGVGHLARTDGKTYCLDTSSPNAIEITTSSIRRLTPLECSRLQTVPEWYIWECSATQQYKMLGNGFTVDVIAHILSFL